MPLVLVTVGAVFLASAFLLAFTPFGIAAAVAGLGCATGGALILLRRSVRGQVDGGSR